MVRVLVEVSGGAARFRVSVQAASVRRALEVAGGWNPGRDIRVLSTVADFAERPGGGAAATEAA